MRVRKEEEEDGEGGGGATSMWFDYIALSYLSVATSIMIGQLLSQDRLVITIAKFHEIHLEGYSSWPY